MPGGGSHPGERRGGRRKGTPNRLTAKVAQEHVRAVNDGGAQPLDVLITVMRYHMGRAAAEQAKGPEGDRKLIQEHLAAAQVAARDAAPYRHPRLAAIQVSDKPDVLQQYGAQLKELSDDELRALDHITRKLAPPGSDQGGAG